MVAFSGGDAVTTVQPELWIAEAREAVAFYEAAFDATTLHLVGEGGDIVAQLAVGEAVFWVATASPASGRFDPRAIDGATGRILLVVDDPPAFARRAVEAGATEISPVGVEHGWLVGRVTDPFGHAWEIGKPVIPWPPR
jgi:PhnB protein